MVEEDLQMCLEIIHIKSVYSTFKKGLEHCWPKTPKARQERTYILINKTFIKDKLTKQEYLEKIKNHLETHQDYINEMSEIHSANPITTRAKYKHERQRKALRKIQSNLKYMFVFQNYPQLKIPKTTNHIDGGLFSPLKRLLKNHNGLSKEHRKTLITQFCNSRGKKV